MKGAWLLAAAPAALWLLCGEVDAQAPAAEAQAKDLSARVSQQEERSRRQQDELRQLRQRVEELRDQRLNDIRAGQAPSGPVGERPELPAVQQVNALPEGMNVLSRPGTVILTPSAEYTRLASNRLVFRGVAIVPGLQLGLIDANTVASDTAAAAGDIRVGLFDRFEVEARVPYYYRHNALTTVSQQVVAQQPPVTQTTNLSGSGLGDVEFLARYQINAPTQGDEPIYIGGLRVKAATGMGPFDVNFDSNGIATELPTGSGFWAVGPTATVIIPSDPAVIFANVGYLHNFAQDINKTIGTTRVGRVEPGDSLDLALGFGLAVNNRFSFSMGYAHTMVFPTTTNLGTTRQMSQTLQAGRIAMGWSYQFSPQFTLNNNFEFGVTSDAPNLLITVRVPFAF